MKLIAVLNSDGGTFRSMDMAAFAATAVQQFAAAGHEVDVRLVARDDLAGALERAVRDPSADGLIAGGGDGTISAAAGLCFRHGKPLGVVPAGTMNLFARSLRMPLDPGAAMASLAGATIERVDIATANGRPFVHQFAVGLHPRLVRLRNGLNYHGRWGKMFASVRAVSAAMLRPLAFDVEVEATHQSRTLRAAAISVSNNMLDEGHFPYAETLDAGVLGVYLVRPMPAPEVLRLLAELMIGSWKGNPLVTEQEVRRVVLRFPHRKFGAQAVIDGELIALESAIELRIEAGGLLVLRPQRLEADGAQAVSATA